MYVFRMEQRYITVLELLTRFEESIDLEIDKIEILV